MGRHGVHWAQNLIPDTMNPMPFCCWKFGRWFVFQLRAILLWDWTNLCSWKSLSEIRRWICGIDEKLSVGKSFRYGNDFRPDGRTASATFAQNQINNAIKNGANALIDSNLFPNHQLGTPYMAPQVLVNVHLFGLQCVDYCICCTFSPCRLQSILLLARPCTQ